MSDRACCESGCFFCGGKNGGGHTGGCCGGSACRGIELEEKAQGIRFADALLLALHAVKSQLEHEEYLETLRKDITTEDNIRATAEQQYKDEVQRKDDERRAALIARLASKQQVADEEIRQRARKVTVERVRAEPAKEQKVAEWVVR